MRLLHLDVEALDVVVSEPDAALVGVRHLLRGIPDLNASLLQEGADLNEGRDLD